VAVHLGARVGDVGENAGGAQKHIVLDHCAGINGDVILHLYSVPNDYPLSDVAVLPEGAVAADLGAVLDMTKMPNLCALAYAASFVHVGRLVFEKVHSYTPRRLIKIMEFREN
jgi:hypothetical protein